MGRINVLKYMKENNLEEKAVLAMKKRFREEDSKVGKEQKQRNIGTFRSTVKTEPETSSDKTNYETLKIMEEGKHSNGWNTFEDESLVGWKYKSDKSGISGHCRYLSPEGDYLNGRIQVLKFMKENKVEEHIVTAMRNTFRTATKELFMNKLP